MTTKLIFIGDDFYWRSHTLMSSIYAESGERYDWGHVKQDLISGKSVSIRPATPDEIKPFFEKLCSLLPPLA